MPPFSTLGAQMNQGEEYRGGPVKHGLDNQMNQGTKGYKAGYQVKKLRTLMEQ